MSVTMKFRNAAAASGSALFAAIEMNIDGLKYCPGLLPSWLGRRIRSTVSLVSFWMPTSWLELVQSVIAALLTIIIFSIAPEASSACTSGGGVTPAFCMPSQKFQ